MTLNIDFDPLISARLTSVAKQRGINPEKLVEQLVSENLSQAHFPLINFPPPGSAAAYLKERLLREATDDQDELKQAAADLQEMMNSMNEERRRSGAEPIF